jgi:hypothetical protein
MGKRIFWIFLLLTSLVSGATIVYIQSESFAEIAKKRLRLVALNEFGLQLDFSRLRIGVFPPSVSLTDVTIGVAPGPNPLGLSADNQLKAERIGFSFRMIQAFSRGIAINQVFLGGAQINLTLPKRKTGTPTTKLSDLIQQSIEIPLAEGWDLSIRQLEIRNSQALVHWPVTGGYSSLAIKKINYLAITPAKSGTNVVGNLEDLERDAGKSAQSLKLIKWNVDVASTKVKVESLSLQRKSLAVNASGELLGNIDNLDDLKAEASLIARGPMDELEEFLPEAKGLKGDMVLEAKVQGTVGSPVVKGSFVAKNLSKDLWHIDEGQIGFEYRTQQLAIKELVLKKNSGKVELTKAIELGLPIAAGSLPLSLRLDRFRLEDFSGELKRTINNLKLGASGEIDARINLRDTASKGVQFSHADADLRLEVKDLLLDNQLFGKTRPKRDILRLKPFKINAKLAATPNGVDISSAEASFSTGKLKVWGSVNKGIFDLNGASDEISITEELGAIAEIPATGVGALNVAVKGPGDRLEMIFDLSLREAKFVNFDFGQVSGRVILQDYRSYIKISELNGKKGSMPYKVSGEVNIGQGDDLSLEAVFEEGDPNDLFAIFKKQLDDISWLPRGMGGLVTGRVTVGGAYNGGLDTLSLKGELKGRSLSYLGESLGYLHLAAGLENGVLRARTIEAIKNESRINGEIQYKLNGEMSYKLNMEQGRLRSFDWVTSTGVPIDGTLSISSSGQGKWETLKSRSELNIRSGFVRTRSLPLVSAVLETDEKEIRFDGKIGETIHARNHISRSESGASGLKVDFREANLDFFLCYISRKNCSDPSIGMIISGQLDMAWLGWDWRNASGGGPITAFDLGKSGYHARLDEPARVDVRSGAWRFSGVRLIGEQTRLNLRLAGDFKSSQLDNQFRGDASLKLLELLTPIVEEGRGSMKVDVALTGTVAEPDFRGSLRFSDGFLRFVGLDAPAEGLEAAIDFRGTKVVIEKLAGQLGNGSVQATGGLDLYLDRAPKFYVDLFLAGNRVKFFPVTFAELNDAKLSFTGERQPYLFSGTVRMKRVMMRNNFDLGSGQRARKTTRFLPETVAGKKSFYEVRIKALAEGGAIVDNNLLDAEFKGEVTLLNNFEFPQILARAELVRGRLIFRNSFFVLDHASIRTPSAEVFNPVISIGGVANVDNYRITIFATGTADKPKISFASNPSLPQEDIVSLLAFGYRGEDTKRINPNDTSALTYSEVGSILMEQLQLSQNLQSKGVKFKVVPSLQDSEVNIIRPNSEPSGTAAPKIYLQTQIMKNLEAAFGGTVGASQGQSVDARLELRLGRKATVSAVYEQSPGGLDATETRNSYGGDLKFRWGFR